MDHIRIKNLRCLKDTGRLDIKPLTICVGGNGSGKSTFIRTFPLLKQSHEESSKGPLLFFGKYVDFGSFQEAKNRSEDDDKIFLSFNETFHPSQYGFYTRAGQLRRLKDQFNIDIDVEIGSAIDNENPCLTGISLSFLGHKVDVKIKNNHWIESLNVNGSDLTKLYTHCFSIDDGRLIPSIAETIKEENEIRFSDYLGTAASGAKFGLTEKHYRLLIQYVRKYEHGNTSDETIREFLYSVGFCDIQSFIERLRSHPSATQTWKKGLKKSLKAIADSDLEYIQNAMVASVFFELLSYLNTQVRSTAMGVSYAAPIRATAERYYRKQNLSVDQVDFKGENLPMFINNLGLIEKRNLKEWLKSNFGFSLISKNQSGHIELCIQHSSSKEQFNLADMGFGYSQVIPILVQLWSHIHQTGRGIYAGKGSPLTFVIEQPELHLHPKMQAIIADCFSQAIYEAREQSVNLKIIIETHSEIIINRVGRNISKKGVNKDDINILVFDKLNEGLETSVTTSKFDEDGYLTNWPYGFFEPED